MAYTYVIFIQLCNFGNFIDYSNGRSDLDGSHSRYQRFFDALHFVPCNSLKYCRATENRQNAHTYKNVNACVR